MPIVNMKCTLWGKQRIGAVAFLIVIISILSLSACSYNSAYDNGYEDALNGKDKGITYSIIEEYRNGYEDGVEYANTLNAWENYHHDLEATASYLGLSISELREKINELWLK